MPLQATSGAASYDAFGGGVPVVPNYIEDVFRTHLYNGDTGGFIFASSGVSIVSGGMMWVKSRGSATNNYIFSPSLTSANHYLNTNTTAAQSNSGVSSNNFEAVDNGGGMRFGGAYSGISSSATGPFTSWTFRKQPKFFDVVTYSGSSSTQNIAHNLGSVPGCIIVKRTSGVEDWFVYHTSLGNTQYIKLNTTGAVASGFAAWNNTSPTSTQFTVLGGRTEVNAAGSDYVAYLFAHNAGGFGLTGTDNVISCGSFTTDGSGNATVSLGYEPQWVLLKSSSNTNDWAIADNMRGWTASGGYADLNPNLSNAEDNFLSDTFLPLTATGFKGQFTSGNASKTYIYIAIRRGPMKVPTSGTSVFAPLTYTGNGTSGRYISGAGFPPDLIIQTARSASENREFDDRLRGGGSTAMNALFSNSSNAEAANSGSVQLLNQDGFTVRSFGNGSSVTYIGECFRRAPSFFDVVCYTGTGSQQNITHNLGVAPELIFVKSRSAANGGLVYNKTITASKYLKLFFTSEGDRAVSNDTGGFAGVEPTSSVFTVGTYNNVNGSGSTYVAYLFSSCAGVSKVFNYTGNGSSQTINCGFTGGARFVLIKRTDSTGNWVTFDTARGIVSGNDPALYLNSTAAEVTGVDAIDPDSTGFIVNQESTFNLNVSSATYLVLAIA